MQTTYRTVAERDKAGEKKYLEHVEKMRDNGYDLTTQYKDLSSRQRAYWRERAEGRNNGGIR
jgi:hypothetical protein